MVRPLLAEWERERAAVAAELERAEAARSRAARMKRRNEAERRYRTFLTRLREFTVLDPACGLGELPLPGAAGAQGPRASGADRGGDARLRAHVLGDPRWLVVRIAGSYPRNPESRNGCVGAIPGLGTIIPSWSYGDEARSAPGVSRRSSRPCRAGCLPQMPLSLRQATLAGLAYKCPIRRTYGGVPQSVEMQRPLG